MSDADKNLKFGIQTDASQGISELDRYNAKLKEMADREVQATKSAKELADAQAYAALKLEAKAKAAEKAAAATAAETAAVKAADAEIQASSKTYTKAMADQVVSDTKAFTSKAQLKDAFKQLGREFPLLGQLGRLALNPIAGSVAALTGAFAIWNWRMKEAMETLVGFQSSFDPKALNAEKVNAAAEANERLATSLRKVIDAYNGVEASSDRAIKRINAEAAAAERILKARDGSVSPAVDYNRRQAIIDEQNRAAGSLDAEARAKAAEAAGISVMDEKTGAGFAGVLGTDATAASAEVEKRKGRLTDLDEFQSQSFLSRANPFNPGTFKYFRRYGLSSASRARAIEEDQLGIAQGALDRQSNFNAREPGRAGRRSQRTAASNRSVAAATGAMELRTQASEGQASLNMDMKTDALVAGFEQMAAERKALAAAQQAETEQLRREIAAANKRAKNNR